MSDPRRFREEGASLGAALLRAARADAPPEGAKQRALEALGLRAREGDRGFVRRPGAALFQGVLGAADRRAGLLGVGRTGIAAAAVIQAALVALLLAPGPGAGGGGAAAPEVDLRAAEAPAAAAPRAVPGGPGTTPATLISGRDPEYTREAIAARAEGIVAVRCTITTEGTLTDCRVLQSLPAMDRAVLEAMDTWRYAPATREGRAVAIEHVFTIRLVLPA
jgi:protein TonB